MAPLLPSLTTTGPAASSPFLSHLLRRTLSSLSQATNNIPSSLLHRRQTTLVIPATYGNIDSSPPPGTIIGIVIGSVAGFLFILWIIYTLLGGNIVTGYIGGVAASSNGSSSTSSVVVRERSKRSSRRRESLEVREVRRPPPVVERIVVEERRESRPAPPPVVVVEAGESSVGSEDEVVVIEEHSPPPSRSRRESGGGSRKTRESGYRTVDPLAYGGGDEPLRDVERRGSRRSNR
jgi:hypothetical protein